MSEQSPSGEPDDGFKEFTIPLETAKRQRFTILGEMRPKLDDATKAEIVFLLAKMVVANYQKTVARCGSWRVCPQSRRQL